MDMFDYLDNSKRHSPLADRMRPAKIEEFIGQGHLIYEGSLLLRAIKSDNLGSCIFFGPPGTGKSTLAGIIAKSTNSNSVYLNAVSSGVADAKAVIKQAQEDLLFRSKKTFLILDECHRWNKAQSDSVLSAIEKGEITFIGTTTENPYVSMTNAFVSRCRIFEFNRLSPEDIITGLNRALKDKERGLGNYDIRIEREALEHIAWIASGDMRKAYNTLEIAVTNAEKRKDGTIVIDKKTAEQAAQKRVLSINQDSYYDILSAFCKSLRGSDSDAALYYSQKLIKAGCDPLLIFRRLIIHAAEDVGMADPFALTIATAAMTAFERIGLPEGAIPLSEAIIYVCEAPKSNSVVVAMGKAAEAVEKYEAQVPLHLRDASYNRQVAGYKYPHDYGGWVQQQYLPDPIKDEIFYTPGKNGMEQSIKIKKLKKES
jgi:putative ATPase